MATKRLLTFEEFAVYWAERIGRKRPYNVAHVRQAFHGYKTGKSKTAAHLPPFAKRHETADGVKLIEVVAPEHRESAPPEVKVAEIGVSDCEGLLAVSFADQFAETDRPSPRSLERLYRTLRAAFNMSDSFQDTVDLRVRFKPNGRYELVERPPLVAKLTADDGSRQLLALRTWSLEYRKRLSTGWDQDAELKASRRAMKDAGICRNCLQHSPVNAFCSVECDNQHKQWLKSNAADWSQAVEKRIQRMTESSAKNSRSGRPE